MFINASRNQASGHQHGIEAEKSKAFAEEVLNLHSAKVNFKRLEEICHEDPESTNRITPVIDC